MNNVFALSTVVLKEMYRRKDFYVLFVLTAVITLMLGSTRFFNDAQIARFLKEACLLLIWISTLVIAITTTARQIPAERENRTIFPLLAKPVTRGQLIGGKFLGCWLACGGALFVFYFFFTVVSGMREHSWPLAQYLQAMWLHWVFLGVVVAMVLFGSVVFAAPSSNSTICFILVTAILVLGRHLHKVAGQLSEPMSSLLYVIYFAIPHLEFFDVRDRIIHHWPLIPWGIWGAATLYGAVYAGFFLVVGWLCFRRKGVN